MPQLGETVAEGKILDWFKSVGDEIREGDNLFEVETDKVTIEVQAVVSGRLSEIRIGPGKVAKVGEVVAVVGDGAAKSADPPPSPPSPQSNAGALRSPFDEVATPTANFGPAKGPDGVRVTPLARRLIAQLGLDLAAVAKDAERRGATKIGEAAVHEAIKALQDKAPAQPAAAGAPRRAPFHSPGGDIVTLSPVRQKTADRLAENWRTIPHVFQAIEVDFTAVDRVRRANRDTFQKEHGFAFTYLPFIARATCLALAAFPLINARFDGKGLTRIRDVNLGVAVDLNHNGLVVPVVHNAGDLTLVGLSKAIRRQIEKAKAGALSPDDLSNGSYSISNNGAFGTTFTAPIINAPQVAILSTDAIRLKPAIVSTPEGDFVAPRMIGMVGQSFDHRAFDGAYSAAFLSRLKQILEARNWTEEVSTNA